MTDFVDPYIDPATGILRNLLGATTQDELDAAEADVTAARFVELMLDPVKPTGDELHLQEIHRRLFQDVYDWAGRFRTIEISKGGTDFVPVALLRTGFAFLHLAEANNLRGLTAEAFTKALAVHFDEVNFLHPFREGNGRTQRILWEQVAAAAGHPLDFRALTAEENIHASREAARQNFEPLEAAIRACLRAA